MLHCTLSALRPNGPENGRVRSPAPGWGRPRHGHHKENVMTRYLKGWVAKFGRRQKGLTTVEYAIAGTLVALAVVTAFTALGSAVGSVIQSLTSVVAG
jgi:pilus assembly protein Flp/PilA